ncbi:hypothetical protein VTO73DRAFT_1668 [Trametes versicolor]
MGKTPIANMTGVTVGRDLKKISHYVLRRDSPQLITNSCHTEIAETSTRPCSIKPAFATAGRPARERASGATTKERFMSSGTRSFARATPWNARFLEFVS